jgi:cytochrome c1
MRSKIIYLGLLVSIAFLFSACVEDVNGVPEPHRYPDSVIASGRRLLASYGCGSCHAIPGVPGANSTAAPPLKQFYKRSYIAGKLPNTDKNLVQWIRNPQQIDPGNAMPDLGVSDEEAHAMAAYLYHQPTLIDWLR